jgi:hypothetical protein
LSSFQQWVAGGLFFPLPDVKATVEIQESISFPDIQLHECAACRQSMHTSQLLDKITSVNWRCIDLFDLRTLDRRLHLLATNLRGALRDCFSNGQSKTIMSEIVSLVCLNGLCDEHNLWLNVSSPYHAEDRSGIVVRLSKACPLTPDTTTESGDDDGYTMKSIVMKGVPDLTVIIEAQPHVFVLLAENKKYLSKKKRLRLGWREPAEPSQIGQLMYYLMGVQLRRIQLKQQTPPTPVLGLYMEDGMMAPVVALATCDTEGDWTILLLLWPLQHFGDGGLAPKCSVRLYLLRALRSS